MPSKIIQPPTTNSVIIYNMKIRENVPLSELTTMRLGGPARYVVDINKAKDLDKVFNFIDQKDLPFYILGDGSNTIAHDEGFDGVIIRYHEKFITFLANQLDPFTRQMAFGPGGIAEGFVPIVVSAGTPWDDVVKFATKHNLTGIEALSKIPGTAGAAVVQNIGAYGQQISDVLTNITVYDIKTRELLSLDANDLNLSYRQSIFNTTARNRYFIIHLTLNLTKGQMPHPFYESIENYIAKHHCTDLSPSGIRKIVSTIRKDKLPDPAKIPSSGSFFKNVILKKADYKDALRKGYPVRHYGTGGKLSAAWLIEQCNLKGQLLHGMRVSDKAPLVLINESAKSYADLAAARNEIITAVKEKFGYTLEQEPNEI